MTIQVLLLTVNLLHWGLSLDGRITCRVNRLEHAGHWNGLSVDLGDIFTLGVMTIMMFQCEHCKYDSGFTLDCKVEMYSTRLQYSLSTMSYSSRASTEARWASRDNRASVIGQSSSPQNVGSQFLSLPVTPYTLVHCPVRPHRIKCPKS